MVVRALRSALVTFGLLVAPVAGADGQDPVPPVVAAGDSVTIRFIDVDLRAVVQALGQYLDRPIIITGISGTRVTLETPRPVARGSVLPLLRGLLESQNLELVADSAAGLYRVRPREQNRPLAPAPAGPAQGSTQGVPLQLYTIRLRHARAADVSATVNALYGRASALDERGSTQTLGNELRDSRLPPGQPPPLTPPQAVAGVAGDRLLMLRYATYSVISPEGCASILWKSADKKETAAEAMGLTADRLDELGLIDEVLEEPLGGAHRDVPAICETLKRALIRHLDELEAIPIEQLREARNARIANFGVYSEAAS